MVDTIIANGETAKFFLRFITGEQRKRHLWGFAEHAQAKTILQGIMKNLDDCSAIEFLAVSSKSPADADPEIKFAYFRDENGWRYAGKGVAVIDTED